MGRYGGTGTASRRVYWLLVSPAHQRIKERSARRVDLRIVDRSSVGFRIHPIRETPIMEAIIIPAILLAALWLDLRFGEVSC